MSAAKTATTSEDSSDKKALEISSKADFDQKLIDAGSKLILLEFHATWCGPCKLIGPKIEQLAALYFGKATVLKVDVDDFEELALEYDVTSMPAFVFLKDKKPLDRLVGSSCEKDIEKILTKYCGEVATKTVDMTTSVAAMVAPTAPK